MYKYNRRGTEKCIIYYIIRAHQTHDHARTRADITLLRSTYAPCNMCAHYIIVVFAR